MQNRYLRSLLGVTIVTSILLTQTGCSLAKRLEKPIEDFAKATSVVTASVREGYLQVNDIAMDNALREAQCTQLFPNPQKPCKPTGTNELKVSKSRIISKKGMDARIAALESLDNYVTLLSKLVKSEKPGEISKSADNMQASLDKLAQQIIKLSDENSANGDDEDDESDKKFVATVGLFSTAIAVVLSAIGNRKRDRALKNAIEDGDKAVASIIEGLKIDIRGFWSQENVIAGKRVLDAFDALHSEIDSSSDLSTPRPDTAKLKELRAEVIEAIKLRDSVADLDPKDSIEKMQIAHTALVNTAKQPLEDNFTASLTAISEFVRAAARLGEAVVNVQRAGKDDEEESE